MYWTFRTDTTRVRSGSKQPAAANQDEMPAHITGLWAWLRSDSVELSASTATPGATDVVRLIDKSGYNRHGIQVFTSSRPQYSSSFREFNRHPAVMLHNPSGADPHQVMSAPWLAELINGSASWSAVAVGKFSRSGQNTIFSVFGPNNNYTVDWRQGSGYVTITSKGPPVFTLETFQDVAAGILDEDIEFCAVTFNKDTASGSMWQGGSKGNAWSRAGISTNLDGGALFYLDQYPRSEPPSPPGDKFEINGAFAELIFYDRELSDGEVDDLSFYIKSRYNIPSGSGP